MEEIFCSTCGISIARKADYKVHLLTSRHQERKRMLEQKEHCNLQNRTCPCGKKYAHKSSLIKHRRVCDAASSSTFASDDSDDADTEDSPVNSDTVAIISALLNGIGGLIKGERDEREADRSLLKELITKMGTVQNNTTNNIQHIHQTFNLQVFLNNVCANAMNFEDFLANLSELTEQDFLHFLEVGYTRGISDAIIRKINELDVTERPFHCTDARRGTLHVKSEGNWTVEPDDQPHVRKLINRVRDRSQRFIVDFRKKHPECKSSRSPFSDQYNKLIIHLSGEKGSDDYDSHHAKAARNVVLATVVDKDKYLVPTGK